MARTSKGRLPRSVIDTFPSSTEEKRRFDGTGGGLRGTPLLFRAQVLVEMPFALSVRVEEGGCGDGGGKRGSLVTARREV